MNDIRRIEIGLTLLLGLTVTCCEAKHRSASTARADAGPDAGPMTALQRVAAIVIPNCAVAGCHDAVSKTHAMDLSTAEKIHAAWVNQRGLDHCTGLDTPRVIPGDPANSLVVMKIEGVAVCAQSQRMPLPPKAPLTAEQIAVIRAWIAEGAPSDTPVPGDAGTSDASTGDAGTDDAGTDDMPNCSSASPCQVGLTCSGQTCGGTWQCLAHFDEPPLQHPCAEALISFCGCDGVTFEASETCPDRPWLHVGACDDGASCTKDRVECSDPQPECPAGQAASVDGTCWGPCVAVADCRCLYHWMCPNLEVNTCLFPEYRCGPNPNLVDAGAEAGAP